MTYHYAGKFSRPDPEDEAAEVETPEAPAGVPVVLNPEAIGDPDAAPVVQLHGAGLEAGQ